MFKLEINDMDNSAFKGDEARSETVRILKGMIEKIESGCDSDFLRDSSGNIVGEFEADFPKGEYEIESVFFSNIGCSITALSPTLDSISCHVAKASVDWMDSDERLGFISDESEIPINVISGNVKIMSWLNSF